ncbi:MAG: cation:proton antiporter, partial [Thermoplasmata archaeon]|nr:cation:proton antiporter [Thermoplasmata archaeon]
LAAGVVLLFHRLRLSRVVAYLAVGILIGALAPRLGVVQDAGTISALAELGVILLIFTIGLEFNLRKLRRQGLRVLLIVTVEVLLMFGVGYWAGVLLGWAPLEAIYLGAIFSIASTMVIVKALMESRKLSAEQGQLVVGILVIEDLAVVLLLALLSGLSTSGAVAPLDLLTVLGRMGLFMFVAIALGLGVVPRAVDYVARLRSRELLLMTVLGLCFGMAVFALFLGLTPAVGAFVMGVLVAEARRNDDVLRAVGPLRDVFVALFFVSMGLLVDLGSLWQHLWVALLLVAVFVVAKATVVSTTSALFGTEGRLAIAAGLTMVAMGEFSLLVAKLGQDLGVTGEFLFPITAIVVLATALVAPFSIRGSDRLSLAVFRRLPLWMREYGLFLARWSSMSSRVLRGRSPASQALREDVGALLADAAIIVLAGAIAWMAILFQAELSSLLLVDPSVFLLVVGIAFVVASLRPLTHLLSRLRHLMRVTMGAMVEASPSAQAVGFPILHRIALVVVVAVTLVVGALTASVLLVGLLALSPLVLLVVVLSASVATVLLWNALRALHDRMEVVFAPRSPGVPSEDSPVPPEADPPEE